MRWNMRIFRERIWKTKFNMISEVALGMVVLSLGPNSFMFMKFLAKILLNIK